MTAVFDEIEKIGIVPVIKIDDPEKAVPLGQALAEGGIPCAEITFRTAQGEEAIRRLSREMPGLLTGAGTVLTVEQAKKAADAGARFVVSPGFNPKVVTYCLDNKLPVIPGCCTPSEIEQALELGLSVIKFFPAEACGGLTAIKALAAPYPGLKFMPTGGINQNNLGSYLDFEKVLACGGSWMVPGDMIGSGDFLGITRLCREAMENVLGFHLAHLGINSPDEQQALKAAGFFEKLFGFEGRPGSSSVFAGRQIEITKTPGLGASGHIGVGVNSISRAMAYLERKGFRFRGETAKTDDKGRIKAIYLNDEILGFAVHLVQK